MYVVKNGMVCVELWDIANEKYVTIPEKKFLKMTALEKRKFKWSRKGLTADFDIYSAWK